MMRLFLSYVCERAGVELADVDVIQSINQSLLEHVVFSGHQIAMVIGSWNGIDRFNSVLEILRG
jgi:hypothetical protein